MADKKMSIVKKNSVTKKTIEIGKTPETQYDPVKTR